jgi:hypothetical protein
MLAIAEPSATTVPPPRPRHDADRGRSATLGRNANWELAYRRFAESLNPDSERVVVRAEA